MHTEFRILLCTALVFHAFGQEVKKRYEFEDVVRGAGSARSPWRSAASGSSSLHMFKGDQIVLTLCSDVARTLRIDGLIYSNDGESDTIDVSVIDHTGVLFPYGTVFTEENSGGWGVFWNAYKSSGPLPATPLLLTPYLNTTLVLTVNTADCYGSEFDALDVTLSADVANETLWCDAKLIYAANPTPCAVRIDNPEVTSMPTPTSQITNSEITTSEITTSATTPTRTLEITTSEISTTATTPKQTFEMKTSEMTISEMTTSATTPTRASEMTTSEIKASATTPMPTSEMKTTEMTISSATSTLTVDIANSKITTSAITPTRTTEMTTSEITTSATTPTPTFVETPESATQIETSSTNVVKNELKPEALTINSIQQNSFGSDCIDASNVNIRFNPSVLKNTIFIARERTDVRHRGNATSNKAGRACDTNIWQIGFANNRNDELGPGIMTSSMTYVVGNDSDFIKFPGIIRRGIPNQLDVKYYVPRKFNVKKGKLEFTLGLSSVNTNKTIGVQYLKRANVNPSDINYQTFSLSNLVNEWNIPAKAVSPSLENVLTLHFDRLDSLDTGSVNVDYLKLEYSPRKWGTQTVTLNLDTTRNIRALKYKENASKKNKAGEIPKGMHLFVDGKRIDGEMEKVVLMHKPNLQIFGISENGEIFVNHVTTTGRRQNRLSIGENGEDQQKEATGFFIGNSSNNIETVMLNSKNNEIKITFVDGTFVTFSSQYSALETRLVVTDTNIAGESVTFFSTHISDGLAGANDVIVDGGVAQKNVMDPSVGQLSGTRFKFVKTNPDHTFDVSEETEIVFPALLSD